MKTTHISKTVFVFEKKTQIPTSHISDNLVINNNAGSVILFETISEKRISISLTPNATFHN